MGRVQTVLSNETSISPQKREQGEYDKKPCETDLPGVGIAGATHEDAERLVSETIALHLEGLAADGLPIPEPGGVDVGQVELPLPA
jgi:hypothetical protein